MRKRMQRTECKADCSDWRMKMKLVLASRNRGKLEELRTILSQFNVETVLQNDVGFREEVAETGETFEENSLIKARAVFERTGLACIADDSGLVVDALDGQPGVYSARFGGSLCKTDADRNALLLERMKNVPDGQRGARFVSVISCILDDGTLLTARGECCGEILREAHGSAGFGYDPLFYLPEERATFAELGTERKNQISHRARAIQSFVRQFAEYQTNKEK